MGANYNTHGSPAAFPNSARRILISAFLVLVCFYILWIAVSDPNVIVIEKPTQHTHIKPPMEMPMPPATKSKDEFTVAERGFWKGLGSTKGHMFDSKLATALIEFFKKENVSTILELGAGTGTYAKQIKAVGIFISCYDGNPDTQDLSEGRCAVLDFSKALDLTKHEWVLSLEVGEHIPKEFEDIFLSNLDKGNLKGLILSWAVEGQGGTSHVNTRNNTYIREKLTAKGYNSDFEAEKALRAGSTFGWFKNTIMVFRKLQKTA